MKKITPDQICFGLNKELDQSSFACFLELAGNPEFAETFAERASSEEIEEFVDSFTSLMKKHFSEHEYHTLFLQQKRK